MTTFSRFLHSRCVMTNQLNKKQSFFGFLKMWSASFMNHFTFLSLLHSAYICRLQMKTKLLSQNLMNYQIFSKTELSFWCITSQMKWKLCAIYCLSHCSSNVIRSVFFINLEHKLLEKQTNVRLMSFIGCFWVKNFGV